MATTMSAQDVFVDRLRNTHAMEKQALSIMQPQLNRLQHYPEVSALLDEILASMDASASGLKDMGLSLSGSMAATSHTLAGDEILKNSFANHAFENFEIAAYMSLITTAQLSGATSAISGLQKSLDEERRMAAAIAEGLDAVTRRYVQLAASDERADI